MTLASRLNSHIRYFNREANYWQFTKAFTLKAESIPAIRTYHEVLNDDVVRLRKLWVEETQAAYASRVAPGTESAWARELKTLFNLMGTAWVEKDTRVKLTQVGEAFLGGENPQSLMERQVQKYQISNPQLSGRLTDKIRVIPHRVLLELLLADYPTPLTRTEFVVFVSKILNHDSVMHARDLIRIFRQLNASRQRRFLSRLDERERRKIERVFSYAAHFLTFPRYLNYRAGVISVSDEATARRVLHWYRTGHDAHIDFTSKKDWFSHYGTVDSVPSPMMAVEYYRKAGRIEEAVAAYGYAARKGLLLEAASDEGFECRIQGEAALEGWLADNLQQLENGLTLTKRQFETEDAGRIDILARDKDLGYVVVELKRDKASDSALGQVLRYIGWVRLNLLTDDENVRGFVVGDRFDDKIYYALLSNDAIDAMCNLIDYETLGVRLEVEKSKEGCRARVVELPRV